MVRAILDWNFLRRVARLTWMVGIPLEHPELEHVMTGNSL